MSKIVLDEIASGYQLSKVNENFQKIEDELNNKVLYRDAPEGEPNTVEKDIDLNGHKLYNVGDIQLQGFEGLTELAEQATEAAASAAISEAASAASAYNAAASAASASAYAGRAVVRTFSGDGSTVAFNLSANPLTKENTQVYIGSVYQRKSTYSIVDTVLTFNAAPPVGTNNIEVVIFESVLTAADIDNINADKVSYTPAGAGFVVTDVQSKLREWVSVLDYGADPTGVSDSTSAFIKAQNASDLIRIPAGTYLLDEFKQKHKKVFRGDGLTSTIIKQANGSRPAWWTVAKFGVYEVQIIGAELSGVWFLGATGATVASCIVEAIAPFVVSNSIFDIGGSSGFHTLEVKTGSAFEVYNNKFRVVQQSGVVTNDTVGSFDTGVVCGTGVYNQWYLRIVQAANGIGFTCNGFNEVLHDPITDCQQVYTGQACVAINPTIEAWTGTARIGAINNSGFNNRFINVTITNVPNASVGGYGIALNSSDATTTTILGYKVYGSYPSAAPMRPILFGSNNSGFIADADTAACPNKIENYSTYDQLKNFTFAGNSTSLTSLAKKHEADPTFVTSSAYTLDSNFSTTGQLDSTVYLDSSANCTITLPSAASFVGRKLYVCSREAFTLESASANVLPMTGGPTPSILSAAAGKWAILQAGSNGFWNVIANN